MPDDRMTVKYDNFAGLDNDFSARGTSRIAILPVPYDKTSTWLKGADKGPSALLTASPALELYDIDTDYEVYKEGIFTCPALESGISPDDMVVKIREKVAELSGEGKFVVVIGGEHSVSIGAAKAHAGTTEGLSVLQLDAHSDMRDEYEGSKYNHACTAARINEFAPVIHVGVRSMCIEEKPSIDPENVFLAGDIVGRKGWVERVLERLSGDVYVTIDMDVFDPSVMPSTGTPEPGGLTWYDVIGLLKEVAREKRVVGFDCVELCPNEANRAPDFMAAKLVYTFLSYIFKYGKTV